MDEPKQSTPLEPPNQEPAERPWQFSLAALMIAMSVVCVLLVLLPVLWFLIDRRTIALVAVVAVAIVGEGKATRGVAIGGVAGICLGLFGWDKRWWGWNEPLDDMFTVLTVGACAAWLVAAIQLAKRGEKSGFAALLAFVTWLPYRLFGQMR